MRSDARYDAARLVPQTHTVEPRVRARRLLCWLGAACVLCAYQQCAPARALILAPQTIAGPSASIGEFGGAAVSEDGSGGVVYLQRVEGATHVFAARYAGGRWQAPVRVDWQNPYAASDARIGAADGGELVVVWVAPIATVGGRVQDALMASTLGAGAERFAPQVEVDTNVGEGEGVSPSLAIAPDARGLVAYRVVTDNFRTSRFGTTIPQLHRGDVLAETRVARFEGEQERWSKLPPVNRDPLLSMRSPSETNGPRVAIGSANDAVVAWQEPEANGFARIWARRIFGTRLGLVMPASPVSLSGAPVTAEATAFGLNVSPLGAAELASTLAGGPGLNPPTPLIFSNTLPPSTTMNAGQFTGPVPLIGAGGESGEPSVSVDGRGEYRVAVATGGTARILRGAEGASAVAEVPLGPASATSGPGAVTGLNPNGGGVTAWSAAEGGVGVREDFPDGAAQAARISGAQGGAVSGLAIGSSESGEALLGFREGQAGSFEIVGERVSVPPPPFYVSAPQSWVRPGQAALSWSDAEDATGGVTYSLAIDGHIVLRGIRGTSILPDRRRLGSGVHHVQVVATDSSGQQTLSSETELMVAATPPVAGVRRTGPHAFTVRVSDHLDGALARATRIDFGDGSHADGRLLAHHTYTRPGRYVIVVRMCDRLGNEGTAHLRVQIR